jgi:hypothetical protein
MNFTNILHGIAQSDPEIYERVSTRRRMIRNWMPRVTAATLPLAIGALFQKAYGKTSDIVIDTLKTALTLERLESSFYAKALSMSNLIPASRPQDKQAIQLIYANESAHRSFVELMITSTGGSFADVPDTANFDFTGGRGTNAGPFSDVFTNYVTFLSLSQVFEDLGVRAYKGAAPDLMGNHDVLQGALQVHSVEARHAAKLRQMRTEIGFANVKPWITQAVSGIPNPAAQPPYAGENNTLQAGIETAGLGGISADGATEAFDEPLGRDAVMTIVSYFIKP